MFFFYFHDKDSNSLSNNTVIDYHQKQRLSENIKRSIHIDSKIDKTLYKRISKEILELRAESDEPINVYLDSPGGDIDYGEKIFWLLKSPRTDNKVCEINTIVHTFCASAATHLLIKGDHATAYPKAKVHYHGASIHKPEGVNLEGTLQLYVDLNNEVDEAAYELVENVTLRLLDIVTYNSTEKNFLGKYWERLKRILTSANVHLISNILIDSEKLLTVQGKLKLYEQNINYDYALKIFDVAFKYIKGKRKKEFRQYYDAEAVIDEAKKISRTVYVLYSDRYKSLVLNMQNYIESNDKIKQAILNLSPSNENSKENRIQFFCNALYFYAITFCRAIQEGEYLFTAKEAFYLGLIDEIVGLDEDELMKDFIGGEQNVV